MDYRLNILHVDVAARDARCGSDRRVESLPFVHRERRLQERRKTPLQAFLWASGQRKLRA